MAAQIRVVEEKPVDGIPEGLIEATDTVVHVSRETTPPLSAPAAVDSRVLATFQALDGRLKAVEQAVIGVPRSLGVLQGLLRALGTQALMALALIGCLALAAAVILNPTLVGAAILGAVAMVLYLPLAALALWGKGR